MKALLILAILLTLGAIFVQYKRKRDTQKLLISLGTFIAIISLAIMGNLTRQVMPIFIAHIVLVLISWGTLFVYMFRGRYYWWLIFAPVVTIGVFLLLELLTGSGHEVSL